VATYGYEVDMERMTEVHSEAGLYEALRTNLVRFATALVGPDDASDVVSDAMESLLKSGQLADAESPQALMHRAVLAKARSMQRSFFRRRAREQRFVEHWTKEQPGLNPDVVDAVVRLSPQQRACVYLTYWEDLTPPMIAQRLGIGEGTVKQYLARARAKLREVLDD
jgi:RNA polymerase sigma factor (sigma-70 family)